MGGAEAVEAGVAVVGAESGGAEARHVDAEAERRKRSLLGAERVAAAHHEEVVPGVLSAQVEPLGVVVRIRQLARHHEVVLRVVLQHVVADAEHEGGRRDDVLELGLGYDALVERQAVEGAAEAAVEAEVADRHAERGAGGAHLVVNAQVEQGGLRRKVGGGLTRHLGRDAVGEEVRQRLADRHTTDEAEVAERLARARRHR